MENGNRYEIIEQNDKEVSIKVLGKIRKYKVITNDDIRSMVDKGEDISLGNCYINKFCYFKICGYNSDYEARSDNYNKAILLKNFNACDAFFDGDVNFAFAQFGEGMVDFAGTQLGKGNVDFGHVKFCDGDVNFVSAHFGEGMVNFMDTKFGKGDVSFCEADFGDGLVLFSNADFSKSKVSFGQAKFGQGMVSFEQARFGDSDVNFAFAQFGEGSVSFSGAHFGQGNVDFSSSHFGKGKVYFSRAQFGDGEVLFHGTHFDDGNVIFSQTQFGDGNVRFTETEFGAGRVIFAPVRVGNGLIHFKKVAIKGALYLIPKSCEETKFFISNCYFSSPVSVNIDHINNLFFLNCINADLLSIYTTENYSSAQKAIAFLNHTNMSTLKLNWDKLKESVLRFDTIFLSEIREKLQKSEGLLVQDNLDRLKADEYVMLKENFHNQGYYDWEDDAYVEFKKIDTNLLRAKDNNIGSRRIKNFFKYCILKILYHIGKYGTDPFGVFKAMIMSVLIFGGLYYLPFVKIFPKDATEHLWSRFYYSAITFFTIGYGDLSAQNGWAAGLCALEGFLGVFLMSYFSVALVRKILR